MAEKKKKVPLLGHEFEVSEVPIITTDEHVNKYTLEDGTVLRVKNVATSMLRVDGQWMPDGNPIYIVMATPVASVESSPLKKPKEVGVKEPN